jgi:NAD(P)-dependent dehydrogenase (short-subunit alcohol dehydrogenase family)
MSAPPDLQSGAWSAPDLTRRVAVVAGSTRGVGRGIAEVFGACGAHVYVTGRSTRSDPGCNPARTVEAVVETITRLGGSATPVVCDHREERQVRRLFERVRDESGQLDILVNNQVGWSDTPNPDGFRRRRLWQRPMAWWDDNFDAGVRGHVLNCRYGIPMLLEQDRATLIFTSERAAASVEAAWDAVFDLRATVAARLVALLSEQLRPSNVTAVLLYPGWTRTEDQIDAVKAGTAPMVQSMDEYLEKTASAHFSGRAAACLAGDPNAKQLSGTLRTTGELAERYGFTDTDGRIPDTP